MYLRNKRIINLSYIRKENFDFLLLLYLFTDHLLLFPGLHLFPVYLVKGHLLLPLIITVKLFTCCLSSSWPNLCIGIFLSNNFARFTDNILIQNIWLNNICLSCSMGRRSSLPDCELHSRSKWSDWLQGGKFSWTNTKYGGLSEGGYLL